MLGNTEGRRRRGQQRVRWLNGITSSMNMSLSKLWEIVKDRGAWYAELDTTLASKQQQSLYKYSVGVNTLYSLAPIKAFIGPLFGVCACVCVCVCVCVCFYLLIGKSFKTF